MPETTKLHPEVVRWPHDIWPVDQPFPLTPLEAWYVMQGWEVAPASGLTLDQVLEMPGMIEGGDKWVRLRQT